MANVIKKKKKSLYSQMLLFLANVIDFQKNGPSRYSAYEY